MKVLHVTPSYYPATYWGGPIWSTKAICDGLAQQSGFDVRVLTTDAAGPHRRARVTPQDLPYPVTYTRRIAGHSIAPGLLARLPAALAWADVVHLTGTYSFPTLPVLALARACAKPVVWSPRGALQATAEWAQAPRRRLKHHFENAANLLRASNTVLHVTSADEAVQSLSRIGPMQTVVIPNAVPIPPARVHENRRPARLLFLGRLHPKKGLDLLIDTMAQLPAHVTLDVYGTGDAAYVAQIKARTSPRITLHGHADDAAKSRAFAQADLFVLPSYSENFGIAVAEALAHGVPVLTTTRTPWQEVAARACGRCIDLARDDLAAEIQALLAMDLPAMGAKGRAWMQQDFSQQTMTRRFVKLYADCAGLPELAVPA